jgi:hypothetical protein
MKRSDFIVQVVYNRMQLYRVSTMNHQLYTVSTMNRQLCRVPKMKRPDFGYALSIGGARGSVVVKALCYKLEGCSFETLQG